MSKIENEAFEWVVRKYARGLSGPEHAEFDTWYAADSRHKGAYARAMAIYNAIHLATAPQSFSSKQADLEDQPVAVMPTLETSRRRFLLAGAMAASIAVAVGTMSVSVLNDRTVLTTAKGEFRKVPLQDKSIATINSASQIEVAFDKKQRKINLRKGEAWFEVAKDKSKPFIVEAGDARIRAVGTAFAVRRFANGTEVLVTEGTVEVWNQDGTAQRRQLTAGERAFLPPETNSIAVTHQPNEVYRRLAWREGKLILKNQTLSEAVADFNRYSPKVIVIADDSLRNKRLFGQYQLDAPELFAQDVSTVFGVPLVITADRILIGQAESRPRGEI
jgi:transmembrane sensor